MARHILSRIPHLEPPYEAEVEAALTAMMPAESQIEPLKLFRTFAHNLPMAEAMHSLGRYVLGRASSISLRDREIVILRFYEGLTQAEIAHRVGSSQVQVSRELRRIFRRLAPQLELAS